jgi:two-component system, OmpR family, response regulator
MRVLVVEDDAKLAGLIQRALQEQAALADAARDGEDALWMAVATAYDVMVLDINLPGISGFETCHRLREAQVGAPILILTARAGIDDRVNGLDAGADDYLVKPFDVSEMLARVRALARRGPVARGTVLRAGDLSLDAGTRVVCRAGTPIALSTKEFQLLEVFMRRPGQVLSRYDLLEGAWDMAYENKSNVIDVYVRYLRNKIDRPFGARTIETVRGAGYRLSVCGQNPLCPRRTARKCAIHGLRDQQGRRMTATFSAGVAVGFATTDAPVRPRRRGEPEGWQLADACHELRTPLTTLRTEVELALLGNRNASELRAALTSAAEEIRRVCRLADDMLTLARADHGRLPVRPRPLDPHVLLEAAAARARAAARSEGREIVVRDAAHGSWLLADPDRVAQALDNLVSNALQHGRGTITLTACGDDNLLRLHVGDQGNGFAEDARAHAFKRFTRGKRAGGSGSGLGLSLVAAIADAHHGVASVGNSLQGGADACIALPQCLPPALSALPDLSPCDARTVTAEPEDVHYHHLAVATRAQLPEPGESSLPAGWPVADDGGGYTGGGTQSECVSRAGQVRHCTNDG